MKLFKFLCILFIGFPFFVFSQDNTKRAKEIIKNDLYKIIEVLSHDSLKGREAGYDGEYKAALYIESYFKKFGLESILPDSTFFQEFSFIDGVFLNESENTLTFNNKKMILWDDFYPLNFSNNGRVKSDIVKVGYGISAPELSYDDYKNLKGLSGKVFVVELGLPSVLVNNSNADLYETMEYKVLNAIKQGAVAVIFVNNNKNYDIPEFLPKTFRPPLDIPVVMAIGRALKMIMDAPALKCDMRIQIQKDIKISRNVIGYLNNNAKHTIVIGGHYDHLGMGTAISRYKGPPAIHPGADDNASGIAAIIETMQCLVDKSFNYANIICIAFGAEEKGLIGSHYFVKSEVYDLKRINYMLNFDMLGRIDSIDGTLSIIGTGSSPFWDSIVEITPVSYFEPKKVASPGGGSDHAPFYAADIPALFFFTGLHDDYHKPGDVIEKLNFEGLYHITDFICRFIVNTDTLTFPFTKAARHLSRESRRTGGISLGIMPDHTYNDKGVKVSDVIENRPAAVAGIKKDDVIIKIGNTEINDIYTYMNVLNSLKKGERVAVRLLRNNSEAEVIIGL